MLNIPDLSINLADYGISYETGFLPCHNTSRAITNVNSTKSSSRSRLPLHRLSNPYYQPWEDIASNLPSLIHSGEIRCRVQDMPILSVDGLCKPNGTADGDDDEAEWQRAYVLLSFLTHAYIWGGERAEDRLPPSIAKPFVQVSEHLELPPCATYAALNLWNFTPITKSSSDISNNTSDGSENDDDSESIDLTNPDNINIINSFTGTDDERWFLVVSVAIEACGARMMRLVLDTINAVLMANNGNENKTTDTLNDNEITSSTLIASLLHQMADCIDELGRILERMYERNDPMVFYHQLRPLLAGSKNMAAAGLPNGVFYDLGDGQGEWRQYSGGSNAQSSLIQLFDIALGIQHVASGEVDGGSKPVDKQTAYMKEMRNYMPGPHRRFLEYVGSVANIRQHAMSLPASSDVRQAYNTVVMKLGGFRDKHIQIVSRYVIAPASRPPPQSQNGSISGASAQGRVNLASATSSMHMHNGSKSTALQEDDTETGDSTKRRTEKVYYGTGGTDLIPFLKATRDGTKAAARFID